jgi:hypothetical protein
VKTKKDSSSAADAGPSGHAFPESRTPSPRKSTVAKVSHTLSVSLAERLEQFAFFQRISESAVIEHSLEQFFEQGGDDEALGDLLRRKGAGRRRKS